MRIDKYLWCIRYYKTRGLAAEAIKKGHVSVNNVKAKASRDVFPLDKITLRRDQINYIVKILDIPPSRVAAKLVDLYRKDETPPESFEHLEMIKLSKEHYRAKGEGRPTKKDRRDISDYTENDSDDDTE
ncbi:RNA-binding S4 domain-containing protein [Flavobacterium sp. F372]|uniref:RNA-binding S4 domain-containing protein n=1 Tax=Flavobacterium bernardetii TaxID=2813823 RepID=A0ABR7IV82_9FLAO|nr:S4 domain-containing protein [Flavobacterium bernardetii]MBC5833517.1 RNA-binding S4 domain-containing protein [Flavobacterium bernardetii]NHF68749.1 RNA-binding S4 domain-containing protein [Flavobacterium bernardetii]